MPAGGRVSGVLRTMSLASSSRSSEARRALSVCCEMPSSSAARVKLPLRASSMNQCHDSSATVPDPFDKSLLLR